ncbi:FHA domain-containing protein [Lysinimonas soli]|uniref:FHA domain-containing protein n=1 Tax=Lysinimonas soli TaxID=1074233 RepID=A0ABW0NMF0_9MICO
MTRDLDDTVARPPRAHTRVVELVPDLEDTVEVRPGGAGRARPTAPAAAIERPVPLVEPPGATPGSAAGAVAGNVWAEPVPPPPSPFRLRLGDGTVVPIDHPVYLGRRPSVPRIHPGGAPVLITLQSPAREVSSTHLELTAIGGVVVASDMRSTNGSILRIPGTRVRTLIAGESAVVTPGTRIELGDGNVVELLAPDPDPAPRVVSAVGA